MGRKTAKQDNNTIWCEWCKTDRSTIRFNKHVESCRSRHRAEIERRALLPTLKKKQRLSSPVPGPSRADMALPDVPIPSDTEEQPIDDEIEMTVDISPEPPASPSTFIKIIHHPHSMVRDPTIIPLEGEMVENRARAINSVFVQRTEPMPWAPFCTRADFEYAESAVIGLLSKPIVDKQLQGINGSWAKRSHITFRSYADLAKTLAASRADGVQFKLGHVSEDFDGETYHFEFPYRSPLEWLISIVTDTSLMPSISWFPIQKFFCELGHEIRLIDEPNSAKRWWDIQSGLPFVEGIPHCFLPLILWMDKGRVTKRVKKHPILLRAAFLPGEIRNASGNGGGVLVGYMPVIDDPGDPADRNSSRALEYANFRRNVYHKVMDVIFDPIKQPARAGMTLKCGDHIRRVLYPGIPIQALDGEEACAACACRAALANHPCPRCLVHHNQLDMIDEQFTPRTTDTMRQVYLDSQAAATKTIADDILKKHGLHATKNAFWDLRNSDPYKSSSYDTLHSDDSGKWGGHLWPLVLDVLQQHGNRGSFAINMRQVPRWPGLKHFNNVTTVEYTDGQAFLDILKCTIPCLVQLLPKKSALVRCVRAYARYRMMISLHCMTEDRIDRLKQYIIDYKNLCATVAEVHGKNFKFYKQHAASHVIEDIEQKGTTSHLSTRPGEGFFQEVGEAYEQTNKRKDADIQMAKIDENQEVIARIRMAIDNYDKAHQFKDIDEEEVLNDDELQKSDADQRHWSLGAPEKITTAKNLEQRFQQMSIMSNSPIFKQFDFELKSFLRKHTSADCVRMDESLRVQTFKCLHLRYQSLENWKGARDILRCNPKFHGEERYDCALINMNSGRESFTCARLQVLLRCTLSSGEEHDIAIVRTFKYSSWHPNTPIEGRHILEAREPQFVMLKYMIRGAHIIPIFSTRAGRFVLNDLIDGDMFLRAGN